MKTKQVHFLKTTRPCRYLRPAEACVVFVGRRHGGGIGSTLVFSLTTTIDNIVSTQTLKVESPCYEMRCIPLEVFNLFKESGTFRVVLVEARDDGATKLGQTLGVPKKKKPKKIKYVLTSRDLLGEYNYQCVMPLTSYHFCSL